MAPGWQEIASRHVDQITGYVRETLSSGLVFLEAELGIDLGVNPDLFAPWVLVFTAWIGLALLLIVWVSVCRGVWRRLTTGETPPTTTDHKADEPKRRNRRRNAEKKTHRNGVAVESQEVKTDKAKKNKKKQKSSVKEQKSSVSDGKEPDEGAWETKISNRGKRQQRRKDKTPGDGSASPEATATSSDISVMEKVQTSEDPETILRSSASTPAVQRDVESNPPEIEANFVQDTVVQKGTPCWEEVLSGNGSGLSDLSPQCSAQMSSVQTESWTSTSLSADPQTAEPSVWPQDMEGSWTIVDGSHIPVAYSGLTAVPDISWGSQSAPVEVDDEWSGINSSSVDPSSDWNAPSEEWGNYVEEQPISTAPAPMHQPIPAEQQQESDVEKEKDEAGAPGSVKARKKKKKKKKVDEAAQAERDLSSGPQAQNSTGSVSAEMRVEAEPPAVSSAPVQTQQRLNSPASTDKLEPEPTQKKAEESWESPKQVKKKKARRET